MEMALPANDSQDLESVKNVGNVSCVQAEVEGAFARSLLQFIYPPLLLLSLLGNTACIFVYRHKYLCNSPTVRLLTAKAVANILFCLCFTLNILYAIANKPGVPASVNDHLAYAYWMNLKYMLYMSNCLAFYAIWITVCVMADHFILVMMPIRAKSWSSIRHANWLIGILVPATVVLHLHLIIHRGMHIYYEDDCLANTTVVVYEFVNSGKNRTWARPTYYWTKAMLHTVIPLVVLLLCCCKLRSRLLNDSHASHAHDKKMTLVRLAMANTFCHFVFETLDGITHVIIALSDATASNLWLSDALVSVGNLSSFVNASIPLLVFMGCSPRFRLIFNMIVTRSPASADIATLERKRQRPTPLILVANGEAIAMEERTPLNGMPSTSSLYAPFNIVANHPSPASTPGGSTREGTPTFH